MGKVKKDTPPATATATHSYLRAGSMVSLSGSGEVAVLRLQPELGSGQVQVLDALDYLSSEVGLAHTPLADKCLAPNVRRLFMITINSL